MKENQAALSKNRDDFNTSVENPKKKSGFFGSKNSSNNSRSFNTSLQDPVNGVIQKDFV